MNLSTEQLSALEKGQAVPVLVEQNECVLVRKEVFDRVQHLLHDPDELTAEEMRGLLAKVGEQAGWAEPDMDVYDRYDEEVKKRCP